MYIPGQRLTDTPGVHRLFIGRLTSLQPTRHYWRNNRCVIQSVSKARQKVTRQVWTKRKPHQGEDAEKSPKTHSDNAQINQVLFEEERVHLTATTCTYKPFNDRKSGQQVMKDWEPPPYCYEKGKKDVKVHLTIKTHNITTTCPLARSPFCYQKFLTH